MGNIKIFNDIYKLSRAAAEQFVTLTQFAIAERGRFSVALSGGGTPESLYALLATEAYANRVEWSKVHVFWGDERCVPPTHTESNYRMAKYALLDRVRFPEGNIHRVKGELTPQKAADLYDQELHSFFGDTPRFDLIFLGMGDDGHTASLFPGTEGLQETKHWAVPVHAEHLNSWRITLTLPVINQAAHITFLVTGEKKAKRVHEIFEGTPESLLPVQQVNPVDGQLVWLLDSEAASMLEKTK